MFSSLWPWIEAALPAIADAPRTFAKEKNEYPVKPFLIFIFAALVSGCGISIRSDSKPAIDSLSGTYRYVGLGFLSPSELPNPLIDFENIAEPCDIEVSHDGSMLKALYKSGTGSSVSRTIDLNKLKKGISWANNELVTTKRVAVTGPIILPLPGTHYRGTRLFRDKDANLVVVGFFEEKGLFWTDYSEQEIVLEIKKNWTSRRDR